MNADLSTTRSAHPLEQLNSGRRYLAVWFPFLSVDRIRRKPETVVPLQKPFALYERERGMLRLAALDQTALKQGLKPGMGLAQARALVPDLAVQEIDRYADARLLHFCASAAEIYTPLLALDGSDGLLLDVTGCTHLFDGELGLARAVHRRFTGNMIQTRLAVAGTPDAAHAFARFSEQRLIPAGEEGTHGRLLPLAALECGSETITALTRAGLRSLGDLVERASSILTARFGAELTGKLNRILGQDDSRITSLRPVPDCLAEKLFSEPMASFEALFTILEKLCHDICQSLERRGLGGRQFEASFFRVDGLVRRLRIETAQPSRDVTSLMRLFRLRFDALDDPLNPGYGFDMLRLGVLWSEKLHFQQNGFDAQVQTTDHGVTELVDRLIARFGRAHVQQFTTRETHDPKTSGATAPFGSLPALPPACLAPDEPSLRPLTVFTRPEPIDAMAEVPDGPPLRFRWRKVAHEVMHAEGPERIAPEWWQDTATQARTCDYYRVEDTRGGRFWIYREGLFDNGQPPRWYMHGLFA